MNALVLYQGCQNTTVSPLLERLLQEPYLRIINTLDPTGSFRSLTSIFTRNVQNTDPSILPALYKKHLASYPQIRDLDVLCRSSVLWDQNMEGGDFRFKDMGEEISEAMTPQSMDRRLWILDKAIDIAELSEDGEATIVTLTPMKNDDLNRIEVSVMNAEIRMSRKTASLLQNESIKTTKTVVLTNRVMKGSRGIDPEAQKELLKSKGFDRKLPDTLTVLAAAFFTRFYTFPMESEKSIYERCQHQVNPRKIEWLLGGTRTQGMQSNNVMIVESLAARIWVILDAPMAQEGVGVCVSFDVLPPQEDIST